ncbi:MAG: hypothetical protein ACRDMZ_14645 [Solirubrobacteraceae bacterium]
MSRRFPNGAADVDAHFVAQLRGPGREVAADALRTLGTPRALALLASVPAPAETLPAWSGQGPLPAELSLLPHRHARGQDPPPVELSLLTPGQRAELAARRPGQAAPTPSDDGLLPPGLSLLTADQRASLAGRRGA